MTKKTKNLALLGALGFGVWYFMKQKKGAPAATVKTPAASGNYFTVAGW